MSLDLDKLRPKKNKETKTNSSRQPKKRRSVRPWQDSPSFIDADHYPAPTEEMELDLKTKLISLPHRKDFLSQASSWIKDLSRPVKAAKPHLPRIRIPIPSFLATREKPPRRH